MMDCERNDLLLGYLDEDALDPSERAAVEAHLAGCAACREALDEYRSAAASLRDLEPPAPSEEARARAYAAVLEAVQGAGGGAVAGEGAEPERRAPTGGGPLPRRGLLLRLAPALAAAACLLLVISLAIRERRTHDTAAAPREPAAAAERLKEEPAAEVPADAPAAAPAPAGRADEALEAEALAELAEAKEAPSARKAQGDGEARRELDRARERLNAELARRARGAEPDAEAPEFAGDLAEEQDGALADAAAGAPGGAPAPAPPGGAPALGGEGGSPAPPPASAEPAPTPRAAWRLRTAEGDRVYALWPDGVRRGVPPRLELRPSRSVFEALAPEPSTVERVEPTAEAARDARRAASPRDLMVAGDLLAILGAELQPAKAAREVPAAPAPVQDGVAAEAEASEPPLPPLRREVVASLFAILGEEVRPYEPREALVARLERLVELRRQVLEGPAQPAERMERKAAEPATGR